MVDGAGFKELNQEYLATSPDEIPTGLVRWAENYDLSSKGLICKIKMSLFQVLSGFAARRDGTLWTHGRNWTEIPPGSKPQLRWVQSSYSNNMFWKSEPIFCLRSGFQHHQSQRNSPTQAYIYWNKSNGVWWIDEPSGNGVYIAKAPSHAPPQNGWKPLGPFGPMPSLVATFRDLW